MSENRMSKLLSFRSKKNLRFEPPQVGYYAPTLSTVQEPTINTYSAVDYDDSLKARNVFVQERETNLLQQEQQRQRLEAERRREEQARRDAQARAADQARRNELAKIEAIERNKKKEEAIRARQAELVKLSEQAEMAKKEAERRQNASAESIRHLRELMRKKYSLDVYIWSKRRVQRANRPLIVEKYTESDRIMQDILFIVNAWDEDLFQEEEWRVAKKIKASFDGEPQYPLWADMPPWDPRRMLKEVPAMA